MTTDEKSASSTDDAMTKFRSFIEEMSDPMTSPGVHGAASADCSDLNTEDRETLLKSRDRNGLLTRLKTFQSLIWSMKPKELSPLFCSVRGWMCKDSDLLVCVSCEKTLCVKLPSPESESYQHFITSCVENLSAKHHNLCPWKYNPAADDCYTVTFNNPAEDIKKLVTAAEGVSSITSGLSQQVNFSINRLPRRANVVVDFLALRSESLSAAQPLVREKSCLLALAGWTKPPEGEFSPKHQVIQCSFCQRKVGVWNLNKTIPFRNDPNSETVSEPGPELPQMDDTDQLEAEPPQMPAPNFALTEMIVNRQLLFSKRNQSNSDWSIMSNAGSEINSVDDAQSVAGSIISNISACDMGSEGDALPARNYLNLPDDAGDPDQWSVITNPDSEKRSTSQLDLDVTTEDPTIDDPTTPNVSMEKGTLPFGKRRRLDGSPDSGQAESLDPVTLHWVWCPWRTGAPSAEWASSVFKHPDAPSIGEDEGNSDPPSGAESDPPSNTSDAYKRVARLMRDM